jgi:hypothetical protein
MCFLLSVFFFCNVDYNLLDQPTLFFTHTLDSCSLVPVKYHFLAFLLYTGNEMVSGSTGVPRGVVLGGSNPPPRNSEVLKKLGQIPISVEYTSVTTQSEYGFRSFTN